MVVCADGGANRLYDALGASEGSRDQMLPDFIVGDLDSLRPEVEQFYRERGERTVIERLEDQDYNDMEKAIEFILSRRGANELRCKIVVYGAFGGRMD